MRGDQSTPTCLYRGKRQKEKPRRGRVLVLTLQWRATWAGRRTLISDFSVNCRTACSYDKCKTRRCRVVRPTADETLARRALKAATVTSVRGGKSMRRIVGLLRATFGFVALVGFMGAALGFGAELIHWVATGTWETWQTLADAWPALGSKVTAMKWLDGRRVASWVIAQPMTLI